MRHLLPAACAVLIAIPAQAANEIPMIGIGLPYSPETATPIDPTHPLYRKIAVGEIEGLPATVKSSKLNLIAAAKRSSINAALRENLRLMNLLALDQGAARARLDVRWNGSDTPFKIGSNNTTQVTLHYRLTRLDNGQILFERDITTSGRGGGVDASMRDNGIVRAAIAANFASAANCLDRAAFGTAPANCALTPGFFVRVEHVRRW